TNLKNTEPMGKGLAEALIEIPSTYDEEYKQFFLNKDFYSPGYLSSLAAFLSFQHVLERNFDCECPNNNSYLETLGLYHILWGRKAPYQVGNGQYYTPITQLLSVESTDDVTASINSCLRHFTGYTDGDIPEGLAKLTHVVGELLDNVWSHGFSTGFAMAQKTAVPYTDRKDFYLEFSIVDKGLGFLEEAKRSGKSKEHNLNTDICALKWCLKKGNSTKHANDIDEWVQQLPPEHTGDSPYGAGIGANYEVNHHQGLGLAHLVELIEKCHGSLVIASGEAMLTIGEDGQRTECNLYNPWKGVAISCKFKLSLLLKEIENTDDDEVLALMDRLKGGV
ncbi:hypothetical protein AB4308_09470, partial [Vibrio breoganii]